MLIQQQSNQMQTDQQPTQQQVSSSSHHHGNQMSGHQSQFTPQTPPGSYAVQGQVSPNQMQGGNFNMPGGNYVNQGNQNVQYITVSNSPSTQQQQAMVQSPMPSQVVPSPQGGNFTQSPSNQGNASNFSPSQGQNYSNQAPPGGRSFSSQCPISNSEFLQSQPSTVQVANPHNNPQVANQDGNYFAQQPTQQHMSNIQHQHRQQPLQGQSMNYQVGFLRIWNLKVSSFFLKILPLLFIINLRCHLPLPLHIHILDIPSLPAREWNTNVNLLPAQTIWNTIINLR